MSMSFDFPDDLIDTLIKLQDDELEKECLSAAVDDIEKSVKKEFHKHDRTGEMSNSVSTTTPAKNKYGEYYIYTYPKGNSKNTYSKETKKKGTRKYPVSNALKAVWLEYGNSHQQARPWQTTATKNCEEIVIDKMQEVINRRIGG